MRKRKLTNKRDGEFEDRVIAATQRAISQVRREVEDEHRLFQCVTGARLAIDAILRAGMLTDTAAQFVEKWRAEGGYTAMDCDGVRVFPPELP